MRVEKGGFLALGWICHKREEEVEILEGCDIPQANLPNEIWTSPLAISS